jgi:hypothetical protein
MYYVVDLNLSDGKLLYQGEEIPVHSQEKLLQFFSAKGIKFETLKNPNCENIGVSLEIFSQKFGASLYFFDGQNSEPLNLTLYWEGGKVNPTNYPQYPEDEDLRQDMLVLLEKISQSLGKYPDEEGHHHRSFLYDWGRITIAYSIRSMQVIMSINKNSYPF